MYDKSFYKFIFFYKKSQMLPENFKLSSRILFSRGKKLKLNQAKLMGILNCTLDSFSDGSRFFNFDVALSQARKMIDDGADLLDIGGESSNPESKEVSLEEELNRVIPLIQGIRKESDIWISVDTWKSEVARQSLQAGADSINDITALRCDSDLANVIAEYEVPVVLMYSKDAPQRTTINNSDYEDVLGTIKAFFKERLQFANSKGIKKKQIILDPGMGFFISGNAKYSFEVVARISELHEFDLPLMLGPSRKSFLSNVLKQRTLNYEERDIPCAVVSSLALWQGISVLRYHEVDQGRLLLNTIESIKNNLK